MSMIIEIARQSQGPNRSRESLRCNYDGNLDDRFALIPKQGGKLRPLITASFALIPGPGGKLMTAKYAKYAKRCLGSKAGSKLLHSAFCILHSPGALPWLDSRGPRSTEGNEGNEEGRSVDFKAWGANSSLPSLASVNRFALIPEPGPESGTSVAP